MLIGNFSETFTSPRCCLAIVIQEELVRVPEDMVWQNILNSLRTSSVKLLFGKLCHTRPLESASVIILFGNCHTRIWFRISTDIYGYAKQVFVTDQEPSGFVIHANQYPDGDDR